MKIIERVAEHYDTQKVEFGRIYRWCPESIALECSKCGKKMTLTRAELIHTHPECECGRGHTARAREDPRGGLVLRGHHRGVRLQWLRKNRQARRSDGLRGEGTGHHRSLPEL